MKRRFLIVLVFFVFVLFLIGFVSTWVDNGNSIQNVDGCNQLNTTGATYNLTQNVSSQGTCFTITQPNITLDCNGYWINYSGDDIGYYFGIETNQFNTTVRNCNIYNYTAGIFFNGADNGTIENNNIIIYNNKSLGSIISDNGLTPRASGILIYDSANYNAIVNNTAYSYYGRGIYINDADNNIIENSNGSSYFNPGIQVFGGVSHTGLNNSIINSFGLSEESNGIRLGHYGTNDSIINSTAISNLDYAILADYGEFIDVINSFGNSSSNVGIYFLGILNGNIINSTGFSNLTNGITVTYSSHNNTISNSTGIGHHTGIVLGSVPSYPSNNNLLIDSQGTGGIAGIRLGGINNTVIRNSATGENEAYHLSSLNNSRIIDCVYTNGNHQDIYVSSVYLSVNNTFLNCSYDDEFFTGSSGEIIRKWYYQTYVNYTNGTSVAGANITAYNSSGNIQFTELTDSSGWIPRQEVTEYVNTGGTRSYYNNYTINATLFGHETETNVFNFTTTQSKLDDVFTLQGEFVDTISPTITFEEPPTPLNSSTVYSSSQTIVANISDNNIKGNTSSWIDFDESLMVYFSMDYYNSTGIIDNSTYNNLATFQKGLSSSNITTGVRGRGLTFDGDDDYLEGDDTYLPYGDSNLTLSLWINPAEVQHDKGVLGYGTYGSNNLFNVYLYNTSLGERLIGLFTLENEIENVFSNTKYSANEWQHIAFSYNGTHVTSYVNGEIKDNPELVLNISNHGESPFRIGWAHVGYRFNGSLDEVMIFNRSLSESEILSLYNSQLNSLSATISNLQDGMHNYKVYAIDEAGNYNSSGKRNFIVDTKLYCGPLNSANTVYTLTSNVSSNGTCFTITQPNITLDCNGYWINYSINGSNNAYGIYSNQFNTTIKNCNVIDGNYSSTAVWRRGIYLDNSANSTLYRNFAISNNSNAIDVEGNSRYVNLTNNTGISTSNRGIYLYVTNSILTDNIGMSNSTHAFDIGWGSANNLFINDVGITNSTNGNGIILYYADNNTLINCSGTSKDEGVNIHDSDYTTLIGIKAIGVSGGWGIRIDNSNHSLIRDCNNLSGFYSVYFSTGGISINNTFINCSYDSESINGGGNELIRKWYYQTYVNYTDGTAVTGANITAYNATGQLQFTTQTNSSGYIPRQEVTEYINRGGTRSYYNNYTINITLFGHETESNIFNFTTTQNKVDDVFTLNRLTPGENGCGVLDSPNTIYTLTQNVLSQGTCFTVAADNITLECNAMRISYSINGENGTYGIYSDRFNTTIRNCNFIDMNNTSLNNERYGIYFSGASNGTIHNNYVNTTNSQAIFVSSNSTNINLTNNFAESLNNGIELRNSSKNNLINNTGIGLMSFAAGIVINGSNENILVNNTGIGNYSGILLGNKPSNNNLFINNTAINNFSTALLISYSNNNYFIGQNATSYNLGRDSVAIRISNSNNSLIKDCLSISGEDYDVYIGDNNVNNTFLNCSYDINKEYLGIRGNLIRKWYYQTYVNYTNGTAVAGANITAYNKAGQIQFTHLTDSLGYIPLKELTDYIGYNGIRNYYSNYSINASKWLYNMESNVFNFTTKGNFVEDFLTLELDTFPPSYGYVGYSSTTAGQKAKFSIKFIDRGALHPYGAYIFSTNNTGTWENYSAVNFTSTPSWANVSVTLNSTVGNVVGYRWYFSDSFGNMNMTPIYKLVTEEGEEEEDKKETNSQKKEESLYRPSYAVLQKGYETYFRKGDFVQINLSKKGIYLFEIGDINRFTKNLTILFNSGKYPVGLNESLKFDLNKDNFYDLQISIRDITKSNSSRINFKEINEEIPASNKPALNETSLGNKSTINIFGIDGEEKESKSVVYFVFVGIIVLALILVACVIFFRFRKAKETSATS